MGALLEPFVWMLGIIVDIYFTVVLAEVAVHWLIHFKILDVKSVYVAKAVEILTKVTQPVYKKISEKSSRLFGSGLLSVYSADGIVVFKPFHLSA